MVLFFRISVLPHENKVIFYSRKNSVGTRHKLWSERSNGFLTLVMIISFLIVVAQHFVENTSKSHNEIMNVDAVGIYTWDVIEVVVARVFPLRNSRVMGIPVSTSQAQQFGIRNGSQAI